ncbi:MAG: tRNA 2-thiouridine(34) synthase MnmA [Candidatus Omnitrophica bacterium]|nr:tRNA 2-thiouridine(34) synthase MnmA [Candidatus Omnitrophota bacterium]
MKKSRVAVMMSGGVDSSVAAALLKEAGHEVIGFTFQLWPMTREVGGCCGLSAIEDAKKVARILKIPHYVLNCRKVFQKEVIDYFCQTYLSGRTPNPCIMCNRRIKFDYFLKKAKEVSADYIASGHYARITRKGAHYFLKKGIDAKRDQSYFLYNLTREQLSALLFPLGGLTKEEVRKKAHSFGLPNSGKKGSQEICFIPDNDYGRFIRDRFPGAAVSGPIFGPEGKLLGSHRGVAFYTVGQRDGLGVSLPRPVYVKEVDPARNALIVAEKEAVFRKELLASDLNWIGEKPSEIFKAKAKIRYRNPETTVMVEPINGKVRVKFDKPQFAVTPGQSIVFYRRGTVLGGGVISC